MDEKGVSAGVNAAAVVRSAVREVCIQARGERWRLVERRTADHAGNGTHGGEAGESA